VRYWVHYWAAQRVDRLATRKGYLKVCPKALLKAHLKAGPKVGPKALLKAHQMAALRVGPTDK